jgi:phage FluMu protein Com
MAVGGGITLFQSLLPRVMDKEAIPYFVIGGMLLVIGAFVWAYSAITCPECKLKLLWYSITKEGLGTWFTWLTHLEICPQCTKFNGLAKSKSKQRRSRAKV